MANKSRRGVRSEQVEEDFVGFPSTFSPPVYTQDAMNRFDKMYGNLKDATLPEALAYRVVRDVIRKNNLSEEDISVEMLLNGTAPLLNTFNFRNRETKEVFSGADLTIDQKANKFSSPEAIFEYFARGPSGEKITPGKFGQGMKSSIIPAAVSFPSFYAGAKATNFALSGLPPTTPLTAGIRIVAPVVGGIAASIASYKPAQTANDYIFGEPDVYLPDDAGGFKGGQSFMEGLGWLYAPYFFKGNIGANLITNFAESRRLGPKAVRMVERGLASVQTEARQMPIRTALVEMAGSFGGAKAVEQASDAEGAMAELFAEIAGSTSMGIGTDLVLKRTIPFVKMSFAGAKKLTNKAFQKEVVDKATTKLGNRRKAELAVYALEMISTVEDPDEIYRRLKWYQASRKAKDAGKDIPQSDAIVIPAKGVEGEKGYIPPVTEADLFREFGDLISETIDPTTGKPVDLPTALAANSLGFMLMQQASTGQSASPKMQRRMNELGDKGDQAYREFREIMTNMIIAGFASEDKDMIGMAAELASRTFASDLEDDLAQAVNRYTDARKRLLQSDDPADIMKASTELQQMVLNRLKAARTNERKIWAQAPDFDIRIGEFQTQNGALNTITLPNGDVVNAPNFISNWLSILPTDPKDRKSFLKDPEYQDLNDYVMTTLEEIGFNITPLADRVESPEIQSVQKSYDSLRRQIEGSEQNLRVLDNYIRQGEQMSPQDAVTFWRNNGINLQENAKDYEDPTLTRRVGRALEALANLQVLRNQETAAAENFIPSDAISSRTLAFRRSKLLAEAKVAQNQGNEQKARFLGQMAASLLDDLESAQTNSPEYKVASAYSRALNDAFTRPFTGKILAKDKSGAFRIAPESVIDSVFNSSFASERARAIDALGKFEISQNLTNLLNLSPDEANDARQNFLSALSQLPSNQQAEMQSFAEQVNTVEPAAALRLIDQAMAIPDTPPQELAAFQALRDLHEATHIATGQNLESSDAGILLDIIRREAFDTTSGFIDLQKLQEILNANSTLLDNAPRLRDALNTALDQSTTTRGLMDTALRRMRDFGFDSEGNFSRAGLERWMESADARGLLEAFPDMKQDLDRILETNGEYLKVIQTNRERIRNASAEQDWFYLLKQESKNPEGTLNFMAPEDMALPFEKLFDNSQTKPGELLNRFWRVAKNAPVSQTLPNGVEITRESAKKGFKSSLISSVMNMAGLRSKDKFSALKAHELFFKPMPRSDGKVTLAEWAVKNDVMTAGEVARLDALLTRIGEIDMLYASGKSIDVGDFAQRMGTSIELLASALGSATASKLYRAVGGDPQGTGSLAVVTRGSTAAVNKARTIMSDMPAALKADFFLEVLENPDLAIDLLETGKTVQEKNDIAANIVNYFASRGFLYTKTPLPYVPDYATSVQFPEFTESEKQDRNRRGRNDPRRSRRIIKPKQLSPQPPVGSGGRNDPPKPPAAVPTTQAALPAPAASSTSGAGFNPQVRQTYAALFPNDPISSMISQQGIGGLMQ